jgi:hypothetical protein
MDTAYTTVLKDDVICRGTYKYYSAAISYLSEIGMRKATIRIIHEDSIRQFNSNLELIKLITLKLPKFERLEGWKAYYRMKELFAEVKYNYAITSHKAQGSSYENAMMIEWDMYDNPRVEERNRIRYVAASRARKYQFIVI